MDGRLSKCVFICIIYIFGTRKMVSVSITYAKNSTKLTANTFIELGDRLNKPLLRLIGKTIKIGENGMHEKTDKFESTSKAIIKQLCRLHPCSHWNGWSKCDATVLGEFGGQTRRRTCGFNTTLCKRYAEITEEIENKVCEYRCSHGYEVTEHGFCLKLYTTENKRDAAQTICQNDGGHLVNIDSISKVEDVNGTLSEHSYSKNSLWIDGRRSVQGGPWKYAYKPADPSFTFWGEDDPDDGPDDLCMRYLIQSSIGNLWRKFDSHCNYNIPFMCEIEV